MKMECFLQEKVFEVVEGLASQILSKECDIIDEADVQGKAKSLGVNHWACRC